MRVEATEQTIMQQWPYKSYIMNSQKSIWTKIIMLGLKLKQIHKKKNRKFGYLLRFKKDVSLVL